VREYRTGQSRCTGGDISALAPKLKFSHERPHRTIGSTSDREPGNPRASISHRTMTLGSRGTVEVARLAPVPLLLPDGGYGPRRAFDAACRLAGPQIQHPARNPLSTYPIRSRRSPARCANPSPKRHEEAGQLLPRCGFFSGSIGVSSDSSLNSTGSYCTVRAIRAAANASARAGTSAFVQG
jgi:hypothetical protein